MTTIRSRFAPTVELSLLAFLPIIGVGIWLGTAAALNRDKLIDQATRVISIVGWSLPTFVLGIWLLVVFYGGFGILEPGRLSTNYLVEIASGGFRSYTGLLTIDSLLNGRLDIFWNAFKHLILPVFTLAVVSSAQIMRVMRSSLARLAGPGLCEDGQGQGLERTHREPQARAP